MTFGEKTKQVREKLFMSQEDFAKELGVAFVTVSRWENGHCEPNYKAQKKFHELCEKNGIIIDN